MLEEAIDMSAPLLGTAPLRVLASRVAYECCISITQWIGSYEAQPHRVIGLREKVVGRGRRERG